MSAALARVELASPGLSLHQDFKRVHDVAICCFCANPLVLLANHWWCCQRECRDIQRRYAISMREESADVVGRKWLHVPLPKQAKVELQIAPNVMYAGSAGPGKSFWGMWRLVRRALAYPGYNGLIVRKQLIEVQATHWQRLEAVCKVLQACGIDVEMRKTDKMMKFHDTGSAIHIGHLRDRRALESLLSSEYDDILLDEASVCDPEFLPELMSRARSTNPGVLADGGAKALVVTNPGGDASQFLVDFFIEHNPDLEKFPQLADIYKPSNWIYIEATLDDNPYLEPDYADKRLANLDAVRYKQLRFADWKTFDGQFFQEWNDTHNGLPWHVQEVTID